MLQVPLHAPTVLLIAALVGTIMTTVIVALWRYNRGLPYMHYWGYAALCGQTVLIGVGLRDHLPDMVSMWLLNGLLFTVPYLIYFGCRIYLGQTQPNWQRDILIGIGLLILMSILRLIHPDIGVRIVLHSLILGFLYGLVAQTIAVGGWRRYPARYSFALISTAHAVFMLSIRPLLLFLESDLAASQFNLSSLIPLESMVFYLLQTVSVILLVVEHLSAKLIAQSEIDPLTQVFNRRAFMTLLNKTRSHCERRHLPLSLMMIDLDHFKRINDSWGHTAGDLVLRQFTQLATSVLRNEDVMGRLGGEEFCIALPDTRLSDAQCIAERLRGACENETVVFDAAHIRFTISVGIAQVKTNDTIESVMHRADKAMYRAKSVGRNRIESVASETPTEADRTLIKSVKGSERSQSFTPSTAQNAGSLH